MGKEQGLWAGWRAAGVGHCASSWAGLVRLGLVTSFGEWGGCTSCVGAPPEPPHAGAGALCLPGIALLLGWLGTALNTGFVLSEKAQEGVRAAAGDETAPSKAWGTNRSRRVPISQLLLKPPGESQPTFRTSPRCWEARLEDNRHRCDPVVPFVTSLELSIGVETRMSPRV